MKKTRTVFQGVRGAFSEEAARVLVGSTVVPVPKPSFDSVFETVSTGKAKYGVLPIENSLVGTVQDNNNRLLDSGLQIVKEFRLRIVHCLIGKPGTTLKSIKQVFSHPVALAQCRKWFQTHPELQPVAYFDTAGAVEMVASSEQNDIAAIASPMAAEVYRMKVLRKSIEDQKFNYTRFILISRKPEPFKGTAKTSIAFSLKNVPGALFRALSVFALRDIDLTKIESYPSGKRAWDYHFFIDLIGSTKDEKVTKALSHLEEIALFVKVLGCYPKSVDRN